MDAQLSGRILAGDAQKILLSSLRKAEVGSISITLPSGEVFHHAGDLNGPKAELTILDSRFFDEVLNKSDIGLGETYIDGLWVCSDVATLIEFVLRNKKAFSQALVGQWQRILFYKFKHLMSRNSKSGSKKNISAHYDLGNDFYRLWLDSTMTYSSAFWGADSERKQGLSLQDAQLNKYQLLLGQLKAKKGDHILEIGCGWGGFAEFAARQGFKVTSITISQQQFDYAQKRIEEAGLSHLADIQFCDYRDLNGSYDHVVSIEMIEAVGEQYWSEYFGKISRLVRPGGRVAIQAIVIHDDEFNRYRKGTDFIQQFVFPGGMLPSKAKIREHARNILGTDFQMVLFGKDYSRTLKYWNQSFREHSRAAADMGYSEEFQRMWTFYLQFCEGAFRTDHIDVGVFSFEV